MGLQLRDKADFVLDLDDHRRLLSMAAAYWQSQAIYAVAETGIADVLSDEPATAAQVAEAAGCNAEAVARLLRYLAGMAVVDQVDTDRYATTPLLQHLHEGSPFRELVLMFGDEFYRAWGSFSSTIRTGRSSYRETYGVELFEYMQDFPDKARRFDIAMEATTGLIAQQLARTIDFSNVGLVIDVGGGNGSLLEAVLKSTPTVRGVNVDRDHVVADCLARFAGSGLEERLTAIEGDFFHKVPPAGDIYILSRIMHDWPDAECVRILQVCRAAMPSAASLLLLERLLPDEPRPALASSFDLLMMAVTGGRERTRAQFETILLQGGFRLDSVHSLPFETSLLVALPC
jgi:hypothetical protein